ncbi:MAG: response regulator transcription factor [Treponema sp.]|nr:response regulator transcription factor [Spirochaetia bacterium]MCI7437488.1 response regulator transcription factor [Spirochaetia bacterium]MDY5838904.1 response regulator transcription factor [Treponema sp.]MEE0893575.1 response regulator transcription factor [Treponema sp.]
MIYILEDDENIRKLIAYTLQSHGYECSCFERPSDFWKSIENYIPDLILLDIMLPEEDGITILKKLRYSSQFKSIPTIMLTAKDTEFDVVTGLDAGADDYITKPFGMMALISRIKAVLRRYEKTKESSEILELGNLKVDVSKHSVFVKDRQVFLTVKEFDLLTLLLQNHGKVMTREQILDSVWKIDVDIESRTVDVHIKTLRQKLEDAGELIETVRGVGYKIN